MNRREAISKVAVGIAGTAVVAGALGYLAGTVAGRGPEQRQVITIDRTLTRTLTQEITRTVTPTVTPVDLRWGLVEGARSAVPMFLIYEDRTNIATRNGLNVADYQVLRGAEGLKALIEKRIDVLGPEPIMQFLSVISQAPDVLRIVHFSDVGMQVSVALRPDSPYSSLEDMRAAVKAGRRIVLGGSTAGSLSHSYAILLARILGTRIGEGVQVVFLGDLTAITAAMERGEVEGFAWVSSVHWRLEEQRRAKVVFYFKDYGGGTLWHERVLVTREDVIRERPETIARFIRFYRDLIRVYETERDYVISLMTSPAPKGYGFSRGIADKWYTLYRPNYVGAPIIEALQSAREMAIDSGVTRETPPIDRWYTTSFL
ncbi:MAG: hypothetical protein NZ957_01535 [Thaumarchaeota archaeon]|nr:hypothetical protein [Candidatus Calditenuaceae archaeon]